MNRTHTTFFATIEQIFSGDKEVQHFAKDSMSFKIMNDHILPHVKSSGVQDHGLLVLLGCDAIGHGSGYVPMKG